MSGENALGLVQEVVGPRQQPSIGEGKDRRTILDFHEPATSHVHLRGARELVEECVAPHLGQFVPAR